MRPQIRALAAAAALAAGLVSVPAAAPPPAIGIGPLPDCRLDDIHTSPNGYDDWSVTQVDWILSLGKKYKPSDLVNVRDAGVQGSGRVRAVAFEDLREMAHAARANGTPLVSWSAYRSFNQQVELFGGYARGDGFDDAVTYSARPGHSEHQLGLAIDFVAVGDTGLTRNWEVTPTGGWMANNAWKYGWLMSYPRGKTEVTCYSYEPWHYRYVGRELAAAIHESGLTIREYLWANYSTVDPVCVTVPSASLETTPSPRPCPLPSPSPSMDPPPPTVPGSVGPPSPAPSAGASPAPTAPPTAPPSSPTGVLGVAAPVLAGLLLLVAAVAIRASLRGKRR